MDNATLAHDGDVLGDGQCLFLIVGHHDRRRAQSGEQLLDLLPQPNAQTRVQGRERFVKKEDPRFGGEGSRQCDPLLLTAREFMRTGMECIAHADEFQGCHDAVRFALGQAEPDIGGDVEVREERPFLGDDPDSAFFRGHPGICSSDLSITEPDRSAIRSNEASEEPKQRGLARATRSEHGE